MLSSIHEIQQYQESVEDEKSLETIYLDLTEEKLRWSLYGFRNKQKGETE